MLVGKTERMYRSIFSQLMVFMSTKLEDQVALQHNDFLGAVEAAMGSSSSKGKSVLAGKFMQKIKSQEDPAMNLQVLKYYFAARETFPGAQWCSRGMSGASRGVQGGIQGAVRRLSN